LEGFPPGIEVTARISLVKSMIDDTIFSYEDTHAEARSSDIDCSDRRGVRSSSLRIASTFCFVEKYSPSVIDVIREE
jgi:hypothetical protein